MNPVKIILHHSATIDSGTVSWNAIRRYHVRECRWGDIGYHFGIERVDDPGDASGSYEILFGRTPDVAGAHTSGENSRSLGICFVGNFDLAEPPPGQWEQGLKLCAWLCRQFDFLPRDIFGHRQFANKTCPGKYFDLDRFRDDLERLLISNEKDIKIA